MLDGGENWLVQKGDLFKLDQNDPRMVIWMYLIVPENTICAVKLRKALQLNTSMEFLQKRRSKWFGHLERGGREFLA